MELVKNILFNIALICGSICVISLLVAGAIKCICIMLNQLEIGNTIKKAIVLFAKSKNPSLENIRPEDVDLSKQRIKRK